MTCEHTRLRRTVRMVLGNYFIAFERGRKTFLTARFAEKREDVNHTFAQHFLTTEARHALHRAVPRDQTTIAIEREDAIDARIDQLGQ